ncbi:hypothetical protein THAOC_28535 [Thalassiosira oceanica]|uniref:Uncharacterized protein n=1 Tax=Thalassiosira oceanica TaxID=159749 RepID=K0RG73_THAOC|nr:hypothetical protein THAOC_28535 [Thalassiosira oceanica]|eukprot:EJK52220.1 hypothetical protein THAOC_28535 [Thalassiosira oceanica]
MRSRGSRGPQGDSGLHSMAFWSVYTMASPASKPSTARPVEGLAVGFSAINDNDDRLRGYGGRDNVNDGPHRSTFGGSGSGRRRSWCPFGGGPRVLTGDVEPTLLKTVLDDVDDNLVEDKDGPLVPDPDGS